MGAQNTASREALLRARLTHLAELTHFRAMCAQAFREVHHERIVDQRNASRLRAWQQRWREAKGVWPASAWPAGAKDTGSTLRIPALRRISRRAPTFG